MIPKTTLYDSSKVTPAHSRADTEELLEKFGVKKFMWKRDDEKAAYLVFAKTEQFSGKDQEVTYKVSIPYIEKEIGPRGNKELIYNEIRSYRIIYHVLKHMLLNTEVGMEFEQVFGNFVVIGQLPDGTPKSVQDSICEQIVSGNGLPALEFDSK